MKEFFITEFDTTIPEDSIVFDLSKMNVKHCLGCWSCWIKKPGRCVQKDLDEFFINYLAADKAYFYCEISQGFVTSNLKALIDRMIVFVLPYISWDKGESYHIPRYTHYPEVDVIYRGDFLPGEEDSFISYFKRTLEMMFTKKINFIRYEEILEGTK